MFLAHKCTCRLNFQKRQKALSQVNHVYFKIQPCNLIAIIECKYNSVTILLLVTITRDHWAIVIGDNEFIKLINTLRHYTQTLLICHKHGKLSIALEYIYIDIYR